MRNFRLLPIAILMGLILNPARGWSASLTCDSLLSADEQASDPMPTGGAFAGDVVENIKGRTLRLLTSAEKRAFGIDPKVIAFANYRYQNQFYIAHISGIKVDASNKPVRAASILQEVRTRSEHWEALTNPELSDFESHSYLQFVFKSGQGVQLDFNQSTNAPVERAAASLISTAVLSIEALRSRSQPDASLMPHAFKFDFAIGHLFYSAVDREAQEQLDIGKVDEDFVFDFSNSTSRIAGITEPASALLFRALLASQQYGRSQTYNFVLDNCTNRMFDIIDDALTPTAGFNRAAFVGSVTTALTTDVPLAITYLKSAVAANGGATLPPVILAELAKVSPDQALPALLQDVETSQDPSKYQTWFPPFVKAHLLGRGLIINR